LRSLINRWTDGWHCARPSAGDSREMAAKSAEGRNRDIVTAGWKSA
jgi:hypothetical protein